MYISTIQSDLSFFDETQASRLASVGARWRLAMYNEHRPPYYSLVHACFASRSRKAVSDVRDVLTKNRLAMYRTHVSHTRGDLWGSEEVCALFSCVSLHSVPPSFHLLSYLCLSLQHLSFVWSLSFADQRAEAEVQEEDADMLD